MRFEREASISLNPDGARPPAEAAPHIGRARVLLGNLFQECELNSIPTLFRTHRLQDGTLVRVGKVGDSGFVGIKTFGGEEEEEIVWLAGIISIPKNGECTDGWGRPIDGNEPLGVCGGSYPNVLAEVTTEQEINLVRSITAPEWGTGGGNSSPVDSEVEEWTVSWDNRDVYHKGIKIHRNTLANIQGVCILDAPDGKHVVSAGYSTSQGYVRLEESILLGGTPKTENLLGVEDIDPTPAGAKVGFVHVAFDRSGHSAGSFLYNEHNFGYWDRVSWALDVFYDDAAQEFDYTFERTITVDAITPINIHRVYIDAGEACWLCNTLVNCHGSHTVHSRNEEIITTQTTSAESEVYSSDDYSIVISPVGAMTTWNASYSIIPFDITGTPYLEACWLETWTGNRKISEQYTTTGRVGDYAFTIQNLNWEIELSRELYQDITYKKYRYNTYVNAATVYVDPHHNSLFFVKQHVTSYTLTPPNTDQLKAGLSSDFEITFSSDQTEEENTMYVTTFDKVIAVAHGNEIIIGYTNFNTSVFSEDPYDIYIDAFFSSSPPIDINDTNPCLEFVGDCGGHRGPHYESFSSSSESSSTTWWIDAYLTVNQIEIIRCAFDVLLHSYLWSELVSSDSENNSFTYNQTHWNYMTTKGESPGPEDYYQFSGTEPHFDNIGLW